MASSRKELSLLAQQSADRLNSALPIHITAEDVAENPEFVKLLESLTHLITEDGVSTQTQRDLNQAEEFLRHEKHTWLINSLLYDELKELITDLQLQGVDMALSIENKKYLEVLQQCLTHAEVEDYLDFSPEAGSTVSLLGLSPGDVRRHNTHRKHMQAVQQRLIPELEERLRQRCENLLKFFDPSSLSDSGELVVAGATQLPALVEKAQLQLKENKRRLKEEQEKRDRQFWIYYSTLLDSLLVLEKMVRNFRLKRQMKTDAITAEWLMAKCDAMCLKIKLLELKVLCDTYTGETVAAHTKIGRHVDGALSEKQVEHTRLQKVLDAYESVGMGFDSLVEEYGKLKQEVENKKWAIAELAKSQDTATET